MALTQISTQGIKDGTITGTDLATNVDLVDNQKLRLGTGNDLQIFHTGTASKINNANVPLLFQSDAMSFHGEGGSETMAVFTKNGAVELYHDNSKKFETKSTGVIITGNDASGSENLGSFFFKTASGTVRGHFDTSNDRFGLKDNVLAAYGNSNDLQIYHNGTDSFIDNSTGNLKIIAPNNVEAIKVFNDGTVNIGANADNVQLRFGLGSDLKIFHNGVNSHIHSATGELDIRSNNFHLRNEANNEDMITATQNGPVELFYDGTRVFETDSGSVKIRDNVKANFGTGNDLQIFHDGSNSFIKNATGNLDIVTGSQSIDLQGNDGSETLAKFIPNGAVELYHDNSKKFETTSDGITVLGGTGNDPILRIVNSTNATGNKAEIRLGPGSGLIGTQLICEAVEDFTSGANRSAKFTIQNRLNGTFENNLIISHTGQALFGCLDNAGNHFRLFNSTTSNTGTMFVIDSSRNSTNGSYKLAQWGSTTAARFQVLDSGTVQNGNGVYQQISDETLKENIVDADSQWNDIKNIKIRKFNFKESVDPEKTTMIGVIAQEVELVSPNLVSSDISMQGGEEKEYKSFKQSILYMKAVKCLQEAMAKIEVLETEVAALKAG